MCVHENLPSISMKSPLHSVSTKEVPVATGPLVSSENESGTSQGRYRMQQKPKILYKLLMIRNDNAPGKWTE